MPDNVKLPLYMRMIGPVFATAAAAALVMFLGDSHLNYTLQPHNPGNENAVGYAVNAFGQAMDDGDKIWNAGSRIMDNVTAQAEGRTHDLASARHYAEPPPYRAHMPPEPKTITVCVPPAMVDQWNNPDSTMAEIQRIVGDYLADKGDPNTLYGIRTFALENFRDHGGDPRLLVYRIPAERSGCPAGDYNSTMTAGP